MRKYFDQQYSQGETKKAVNQVSKLHNLRHTAKLQHGDAHLKNFGMLYEHPAAARKLAPIYDAACTNVYPELDGKMALKMHKSKTFPNDAELVAYRLNNLLIV